MEDAPRLAIGEVRQTRHQRQRQQQRAELCKADRIDHRIEQLCLDPLKREQRQVGGDDDQRCEEDRLRDLMGRRAGVGLGEGLVGFRLATPQDRFRHHNGGIDDDSEIDGAERQQVRWNLEEIHQNENRHHGERDGDADDHGAARTA